MSNCWRLRSYDQSPPGSYIFYQDGRKFTAPMIEPLGRILSDYRKSNGRDRADIKECIADIDHFTCQRLGNMPTFCIECNGTAKTALSPTSPIAQPPCAGCGAKVE